MSVLLLALGNNMPKDSTDIVPLTLDMYRYPKTLYSSDDEKISQKYKDIVQQYNGEAEYIAPDISVTNGNCNFASYLNVSYHIYFFMFCLSLFLFQLF